MIYVLIGFVAAVIALAAYVRLAPSDPRAWHKTFHPRAPGTYPQAGAFTIVREVDDPQATLVRLHAIIRETPRTTVLAGSVDEGMVTYITRSRLWGFPDYTTVSARADDRIEGVDGSVLKIQGRLRFGKSDMGVNRARIEGWLAQLDAGDGQGTPTQ